MAKLEVAKDASIDEIEPAAGVSADADALEHEGEEEQFDDIMHDNAAADTQEPTKVAEADPPEEEAVETQPTAEAAETPEAEGVVTSTETPADEPAAPVAESAEQGEAAGEAVDELATLRDQVQSLTTALNDAYAKGLQPDAAPDPTQFVPMQPPAQPQETLGQPVPPGDVPTQVPVQPAMQVPQMQEIRADMLMPLVTPEEHERALEDPNAMNVLLNKSMQGGFAHALKAIPAIVRNQVREAVAMRAFMEDFYRQNEDLIPLQAMHGHEALQVADEHPEYTPEQALTEAGKRLRTRLAIGAVKAPAPAEQVETPASAPESRPAFVSGTTGGMAAPAKGRQRLSDMERQFAEMVPEGDW